MKMLSTAQEVCGTPWLVIAIVIALLNTLVALRLVFFTQSVVSLVAFKPVAFLPLVLGVLSSSLGLLQSLEIAMSEDSGEANPALLLSWGLLPVVLGGALSTPAFTIAALGRLWLATRVIRTPSPKQPTRAALKAQQDADDEAAYQSYADFVNGAGHRKSKS